MNSLPGFGDAAQAWADWMLAASWQLALLIAVIALLAFALRRFSARLRYLLWMLVLVKALTPPTLGTAWGLGNWLPSVFPERIQTAIIPSQAIAQPASASLATSIDQIPFAPETPKPAPSPSLAQTSADHPQPAPPAADLTRRPTAPPSDNSIPRSDSAIDPAQLVFTVWLAGIALFALVIGVQYARITRSLRSARLAEEGLLRITLERLALRLGCNNPPDLLLAETVSSPFLFGLFRPRIVLPLALERSLSLEQIEDVLLRELTHWRRRDLWISWLQIIVQGLFWFHPLVWLAGAQLRHECECSCDEALLESGCSRARRYGATLLHVLLTARGRSSVAVGMLGIFERNTRLQRRVEAIMEQESQARRFGWTSWALLAVFAVFVLPMTALHSNQSLAQEPATEGQLVEDQALNQKGKLENESQELLLRKLVESMRNSTNYSRIAGTTNPQIKLNSINRWISLLNDNQRAFVDWTNRRFDRFFDRRDFSTWPAAERMALLEQTLRILGGPQNREYYEAINTLGAIGDPKAVQPLLAIATDRIGEDCRDNWMATRALGMIGDKSVVPALCHLVYHTNTNTHFWGQITLVRLTGQNFGYDWMAWGNWWNEQGGQPRFTPEKIRWWDDPQFDEASTAEALMKADAEFLAKNAPRSGALPADTSDAAENSASTSALSGAPQILNIAPAIGATDIDPQTSEIVVTFDRDMNMGGFSWTGGGPEFPPMPEGSKPLWRDPRTCVLPVKLEPGKFYRLGINSKSFKNFRSADGVPVIPLSIYFTTAGAGAEEQAKQLKPQIVSMEPANNATGVDPKITELRVTFNMPMGGGMFWTGGGEHFPQIPEGQRGRWSDDQLTCILPVTLKQNWAYQLGLNSPSFQNFTSASGVPLEPVVYRFGTGN